MDTFNKKLTPDGEVDPKQLAFLLLRSRKEHDLRHLHESVKANIAVICAKGEEVQLILTPAGSRFVLTLENVYHDVMSKSGYGVKDSTFYGFMVAYGLNFMALRSLILTFPMMFRSRIDTVVGQIQEKLLRYQTIGQDVWEVVAMLCASLDRVKLNNTRKGYKHRTFQLLNDPMLTVPVMIKSKVLQQLEVIREDLCRLNGEEPTIERLAYMALILGVVLYDYNTFMYLCQDIMFEHSETTDITKRKLEVTMPDVDTVLLTSLSEELIPK